GRTYRKAKPVPAKAKAKEAGISAHIPLSSPPPHKCRKRRSRATTITSYNGSVNAGCGFTESLLLREVWLCPTFELRPHSLTNSERLCSTSLTLWRHGNADSLGSSVMLSSC